METPSSSPASTPSQKSAEVPPLAAASPSSPSQVPSAPPGTPTTAPAAATTHSPLRWFIVLLFLGLAAVVLGAVIFRDSLPTDFFMGKETGMDEPSDGFGADIYDSVSGEASAEAMMGVPETDPLHEVEADPFAGYVNPFE